MKTVHSVLKNYYEANELNHEVKIEGFVADICNGKEIIEIQTRSFDRLRKNYQFFYSIFRNYCLSGSLY